MVYGLTKHTCSERTLRIANEQSRHRPTNGRRIKNTEVNVVAQSIGTIAYLYSYLKHKVVYFLLVRHLFFRSDFRMFFWLFLFWIVQNPTNTFFVDNNRIFFYHRQLFLEFFFLNRDHHFLFDNLALNKCLNIIECIYIYIYNYITNNCRT